MENQDNKSTNDQTNTQSGQGENQNNPISQPNNDSQETKNDNLDVKDVKNEENTNFNNSNTQPHSDNNQDIKEDQNTDSIPNEVNKPIIDDSQNQNTNNSTNNEVKVEIKTEPKIDEPKIDEPKTDEPEQKKVNFNTYTPNINEKDGEKEEKTNDSPEDEGKTSKTGTIIVAILIVVIAYGIWNANKSNNNPEVAGDGEENNEISIVVDDTKEDGEVKIVEEGTKEDKEENDSREIGEKIKIIAYYSQNSDDCSKVLPLEREMAKKYDSNVINTVRGLLTVLTEEEANQGWTSNIPVGTYLKYVNVKNSVAEISLTSALGNTAGSCAVTAVKAQIEQTLLQFPYISSVNICIEDNCNQNEILQP